MPYLSKDERNAAMKSYRQRMALSPHRQVGILTERLSRQQEKVAQTKGLLKNLILKYPGIFLLGAETQPPVRPGKIPKCQINERQAQELYARAEQNPESETLRKIGVWEAARSAAGLPTRPWDALRKSPLSADEEAEFQRLDKLHQADEDGQMHFTDAEHGRWGELFDKKKT
jgi:hypothetical protein